MIRTIRVLDHTDFTMLHRCVSGRAGPCCAHGFDTQASVACSTVHICRHLARHVSKCIAISDHHHTTFSDVDTPVSVSITC